MGRLPERLKGRALMRISDSDREKVRSAIPITREREQHIVEALEFVKTRVWNKVTITEKDIFTIYSILGSIEGEPSYRKDAIQRFVYETDEFGERRLSLEPSIFETPGNIPGEVKKFIAYFNHHPFTNFNARTIWRGAAIRVSRPDTFPTTA